MIKQATAVLDYSIDCVCPHCHKEVDIVELESNSGEHDISRLVFTNRWCDVKGYSITCPHCQQDFELDKLEY